MKNVIYKIRNVVNDKFYVGSTVDSRKRFWAHRKALRAGTHPCIRLQRSWNKHGEDCFKFEIIEQHESKEALFPAEQKWLDAHFGTDYCYNVAAHADAPMRDASPEIRAILAAKTKAWLLEKGHPNQGLVLSDEMKLKIREGRLRTNKNKGENHYRYGQTLSEEVRKKIGDTQRGVKKKPRKYTEEGLIRARENMKRNAREQLPNPIEEVLSKFPIDIQNKYDFTNAVYTGALNRIEGCVCPEHGVFSQYAAQFRKGRGCPSCGAVERAANKKKQMLEFWNTAEGREKFMKNRTK